MNFSYGDYDDYKVVYEWVWVVFDVIGCVVGVFVDL